MRIRTLLTTASAMALSFGVMAGAASADDNKLFVEQVGNANFEGSAQLGSNNETFVSQQGSLNSAGASASEGNAGSANNNRVLVDQNGNRNLAAMSFVSGANRFDQNMVGIVQNTSRNYTNLNLTQDRAGTNGVFNSTIYVEQGGSSENFVGGTDAVSTDVGNGQFAGQITNDGVSNASLEGSTATGQVGFGLIRGQDQFFGLVQDGFSNAFAVSMDGQGNEIGGSGGNSATARDLNTGTNTGSFFSGDTTIDAPGGAGSFGVSGLAQQVGTDNVGVVSVSGTNNAVGFSQTGNSNVAEVYQQGNNNNASAVQQ